MNAEDSQSAANLKPSQHSQPETKPTQPISCQPETKPTDLDIESACKGYTAKSSTAPQKHVSPSESALFHSHPGLQVQRPRVMNS